MTVNFFTRALLAAAVLFSLFYVCATVSITTGQIAFFSVQEKEEAERKYLKLLETRCLLIKSHIRKLNKCQMIKRAWFDKRLRSLTPGTCFPLLLYQKHASHVVVHNKC